MSLFSFLATEKKLQMASAQTQSKRLDEEKALVTDYAGLTFKQVYGLIDPRFFKYGEMGGYVSFREKLLFPVLRYAEYDHKIDKPYYRFDFRVPEFRDEAVLWHLHPFQGEDVHNSFPSYADLVTALQHPSKMFLLLTKLGCFFYRSKHATRQDLNLSYYKEILLPEFEKFWALESLNDPPFQSLTKDIAYFVFVPKRNSSPLAMIRLD